MTKPGNALAALATLGLTSEEMQKNEERLVTFGYLASRDSSPKLICLCGHGVSRHTEYAGLVSCVPSRLVCNCKTIRPVLQVDDTRPFKMKTFGPGANHALIRGLSACVDKDKGAHWVADLKCDKCEKMGTDAGVVPTPVSSLGKVLVDSFNAVFTDALLCKSCRDNG